MAYRGRGGGRGGRGRGGGGLPRYEQISFPLFPEYKGLGTAEFKREDGRLVKWSLDLQNYWKESPYYYEERTQHQEKQRKSDIQRFSDAKSQASRAKPPLWHFIKLDSDHVPAELALGGKNSDKRVVKRVRWNPESGMQKFDVLEKLEQKREGAEDKEEEEEEVEEEEDEGEFSDDGDYGQNEDFDDDDMNDAEDDAGGDEAMY